MNPFAAIRSLFSRLRGRSKRPAATHQGQRPAQAAPPQPPPSGMQTGTTTHAARMAASVGNLFAPTAEEAETIGISEIDDPANIQRRHQSWAREGDGLRMAEHVALVLTADGTVVPPHKLKGRCRACSGYIAEEPLFRCYICSAVLCRNHAKVFVLPDGTQQTLCPEHTQRAAASYSFWAQFDARRARDADLERGGMS